MEKLINNLSSMKDMIIEEKSKYQQNIIAYYNTFSTRLDELSIFFYLNFFKS